MTLAVILRIPSEFVSFFAAISQLRKFIPDSIYLKCFSLIFSSSIEVEQEDTNCYLKVAKGASERVRFVVQTTYIVAPMLICLVIIFASYVATFLQIRSLDESVAEGMKVKPYRLFWYPAIVLLMFVPRLIDNGIKNLNNGQSIFIFKLIHIVAAHSVGLANAFVFGAQMRSYYKRYQDYQSDPLGGDSSFLGESLEEEDIRKYNI